MEFLRDLSRRHEELKKRIHNFRLPLSPGWRAVATGVYISIPIVSGYFIMQTAIAQSVKNLGPRGEKLDGGVAPGATSAGAPDSVNAAVADQKRALQLVLDRHKRAKELQQQQQQNK